MFENDILVGCRLFHVGNLTRCAVGTQVVSGMSRMSVLANGSSSDISRRTWPQSMREIWPISNNYRCVYTSRVSVEISFRSHWGQGEVDDLTTEAEVCVRWLYRECVIVHIHFNIAVVSKCAPRCMGKSDTDVPSPKSHAMWILAFHFTIVLPWRITTSMQ